MRGCEFNEREAAKERSVRWLEELSYRGSSFKEKVLLCESVKCKSVKTITTINLIVIIIIIHAGGVNPSRATSLDPDSGEK